MKRLKVFLLPLDGDASPSQGYHQHCENNIYYMTSTASEQDESNLALWLATRAGKIAPSCPLGATRRVPLEKFSRKPYNKFFYWPSLFGQDGWILASFFFFFCVFMDLDYVSVHKHAKKALGQYPTILTSHLVNNPYVLLKTTTQYPPPGWREALWE